MLDPIVAIDSRITKEKNEPYGNRCHLFIGIGYSPAEPPRYAACSTPLQQAPV